jgi:hypothetical protein
MFVIVIVIVVVVVMVVSNSAGGDGYRYDQKDKQIKGELHSLLIVLLYHRLYS